MADVQTTTSLAAGVAGTAASMKYAFACIAAHAFLPVDDGLVTIWAAAIFPFAHMIYLGFKLWFSKQTGVPVEALAAAAPAHIEPPIAR